MKSVYSTFRHLGMYLHTIMFRGGGEAQLQAMAQVAGQNGRYHYASTNDLVTSFTNIAKDCSMRDALVGQCSNIVT